MCEIYFDNREKEIIAVKKKSQRMLLQLNLKSICIYRFFCFSFFNTSSHFNNRLPKRNRRDEVARFFFFFIFIQLKKIKKENQDNTYTRNNKVQFHNIKRGRKKVKKKKEKIVKDQQRADR